MYSNTMITSLKYGSTAPGRTFLLILLFVKLLRSRMSYPWRQYAHQLPICFFVSSTPRNNAPADIAGFIGMKNKSSLNVIPIASQCLGILAKWGAGECDIKTELPSNVSYKFSTTLLRNILVCSIQSTPSVLTSTGIWILSHKWWAPMGRVFCASRIFIVTVIMTSMWFVYNDIARSTLEGLLNDKSTSRIMCSAATNFPIRVNLCNLAALMSGWLLQSTAHASPT